MQSERLTIAGEVSNWEVYAERHQNTSSLASTQARRGVANVKTPATAIKTTQLRSGKETSKVQPRYDPQKVFQWNTEFQKTAE